MPKSCFLKLFECFLGGSRGPLGRPRGTPESFREVISSSFGTLLKRRSGVVVDECFALRDYCDCILREPSYGTYSAIRSLFGCQPSPNSCPIRAQCLASLTCPLEAVLQFRSRQFISRGGGWERVRGCSVASFTCYFKLGTGLHFHTLGEPVAAEAFDSGCVW